MLPMKNATFFQSVFGGHALKYGPAPRVNRTCYNCRERRHEREDCRMDEWDFFQYLIDK